MKDNKFWKGVFILTAVLLAAFLVFVGVSAYRNINYSGHYPYPTIAGTVNNWWDGTIVDVGIFFPFYGLPLIADIVFFIISGIKLIKNRRGKK